MALAKDGMKKCSNCGEVKPVGEFAKDKHNKDGYHCWCKTCKNKQQLEYSRSEKGRATQQRAVDRKIGQKYAKCVSNPKCPRVGTRGAEFITITCPVCGKEFRMSKARYDKYPQIYCSRDCYLFSRWGDSDKTHLKKYREEIDKLLYGIE